MEQKQKLGVTDDVYDMEDQEDEITVNRPQVKITVKGVSTKQGIPVLAIQHQSLGRGCTCWLPLKESEPLNKKNREGKLSLKKKQESRGGYYQLGGGKSKVRVRVTLTLRLNLTTGR